MRGVFELGCSVISEAAVVVTWRLHGLQICRSCDQSSSEQLEVFTDLQGPPGRTDGQGGRGFNVR